MAIIKNPLSVCGGSFEVMNGVIEEYLASSSTINANTFVEFVSQYIDTPMDNDQYTTTIDKFWPLSAVALSNDKVFVAYAFKSGTKRRVSGRVFTISGTTFTGGNEATIVNSVDTVTSISAVALSSTKVFIACTYNPDSNTHYLYGKVASIDGTTLSYGVGVQLTTQDNSGYHISAVALSNTKVFIAHSASANSYLMGMLVSIGGTGGTSITASTDTQLSLTSASTLEISAVQLGGVAVFIAHTYGASGYLYGISCIINGTSVYIGTDTALVLGTYPGRTISAVALDNAPLNGRVFIAHSYGENDDYYLYGVVATLTNINTGTLTAGTDTQLSTDSNLTTISAVAFSDSEVFVAHSGYSLLDPRLFGVECAIRGTNIAPGTVTQLSNYTDSGLVISALTLRDGRLLVAHRIVFSGNHKLFGLLQSETVQASTNRIDGLTKTACTTSTAGEVWVLDTSS